MKIAYFLRDDGACGFYRVSQPLQKLAWNNPRIKIEGFKQGESLDKLVQILEEADIIIIPRLCEPKFLEMAKAMQKEGKRIVVDHDDNLLKVSPFSPHYVDFGTEEVEMQMADGHKVKLWEDGKNIDLKRNVERIAIFIEALGVADLVTTTTPVLAKVFSQWAKRVAVLPNCIDTQLWKAFPSISPPEVRMGWYGGASHFEDWVLLRDALPYLFSQHPQLKLVLMGQKFDGTLKGVPRGKVEFHPWIPTPAYPYKAALLNLNFMVIPLVENWFNACKSPIKWIEQAALGVPCVTSYVSPYKELEQEHRGVWVENTKEAWIQGIDYMIRNITGREKMGQQAKHFVEQHYDINTQWSQWEKVYNDIL